VGSTTMKVLGTLLLLLCVYQSQAGTSCISPSDCTTECKICTAGTGPACDDVHCEYDECVIKRNACAYPTCSDKHPCITDTACLVCPEGSGPSCPRIVCENGLCITKIEACAGCAKNSDCASPDFCEACPPGSVGSGCAEGVCRHNECQVIIPCKEGNPAN